jgi:hypothetical protein
MAIHHLSKQPFQPQRPSPKGRGRSLRPPCITRHRALFDGGHQRDGPSGATTLALEGRREPVTGSRGIR